MFDLYDAVQYLDPVSGWVLAGNGLALMGAVLAHRRGSQNNRRGELNLASLSLAILGLSVGLGMLETFAEEYSSIAPSGDSPILLELRIRAGFEHSKQSAVISLVSMLPALFFLLRTLIWAVRVRHSRLHSLRILARQIRGLGQTVLVVTTAAVVCVIAPAPVRDLDAAAAQVVELAMWTEADLTASCNKLTEIAIPPGSNAFRIEEFLELSRRCRDLSARLDADGQCSTFLRPKLDVWSHAEWFTHAGTQRWPWESEVFFARWFLPMPGWVYVKGTSYDSALAKCFGMSREDFASRPPINLVLQLDPDRKPLSIRADEHQSVSPEQLCCARALLWGYESRSSPPALFKILPNAPRETFGDLPSHIP